VHYVAEKHNVSWFQLSNRSAKLGLNCIISNGPKLTSPPQRPPVTQMNVGQQHRLQIRQPQGTAGMRKLTGMHLY
jgi:hypothetical protein